jgi:DDE_Tnp_1-associated
VRFVANLTVRGSDAAAAVSIDAGSFRDLRKHAKVPYPQVVILLLALSATIAGADDFGEITLWGQENQTDPPARQDSAALRPDAAPLS